MPTALSASEYIHEGVWINWNKGRVLGSTLTVDPYHASILSPALAVLVSIAGSQLWGIFQFAMHQIRATPSPRSLLYHQQQTILRNTATDLNTLWRLGRVAFAWKHQRDAKVWKESLPLLLWAFLHFCLIVLAGLFSSWALTAGDEVLSRSPWCGTLDSTYVTTINSRNMSDTEAVKLAMEAQSYANSQHVAVQQHVDICQSAVEGCDSFPVDDLTWNSSLVPKGCPFEQSICHPNTDGSIAFDTGYLSSSTALGFNTRKEDRVSFRMVAECAPLNDVKYSTGWQNVSASGGLPARQIADTLYGPSSMNDRNATFSLTRQNLDCDQRAITPSYSLDAEYAMAGGNVSLNTATFNPIAELQLAEADLSLVVLSYINAYQGPVFDPWFSAQQAVNDNNAFCLQQEQTVYTRDIPLTTIGCTQQWQVCSTESPAANATASGQCTPLLGWMQIAALLSEPPQSGMVLSPVQRATASRILDASLQASFYYTIAALSQANGTPLKARNLMFKTAGSALPDNQWQIETKYWMEILLANLQQASLDASTGQNAASTAYINVTRSSASDPAQDAAYRLCQNQIIRSSAYRNFNFFALIFTVVVCTIIIVAGVTIEDLMGYIRQRKLNYSGPDGKQDMWVANSVLEMLKTIDEAKHQSIWTRSSNGVPVTHAGHKVSIHDLAGDSVDVVEGVGTINSALKRQQTALNEKRTESHPYGWRHGSGHKRCATYSSFDLSPSKGSSTSATQLTGQSLPTQPGTDGLVAAAHHGFSRDLQKDSTAIAQQNGKRRFRIGNFTSATSATTAFTNPYVGDLPPGHDGRSAESPLDSASDEEQYQNYSYPTSTPLNRRTQDLNQVYEPPSPDPRQREQDAQRPSSGWGVPKKVSHLWGSSGAGLRRPSSGYIQ